MSLNIVGDFNTSVRKAFEEIPDWDKGLKINGLVLCGTHNPKNMEELLEWIKYYRENDLPFLGICWGMELMAIEYARNVMGIKDATSAEVGPGTHVIEKLPELRVGIKPVDGRMESHWHNYGMSYEWAQKFTDFDITFGDGVVEEMRLPRSLHHFGVQYHPEYQSSAKNPHPVLERFLKLCK